MRRCGTVAILILFGSLAMPAALAENAVQPAGEPVLDPPTLHCLGVYWIVRGDGNGNARIDVAYRKAGAAEWRNGYPLFRVEKDAHKAPKPGAKKGETAPRESKLDVPADGWLFAGSIVLLDPDTEYEIKLSLSDPDGGAAEKTLKCRTIAEPAAPKDAPQRHVVPGGGGGSGTKEDPFKGLDAAQAAARPGDIFLLHAGNYGESFAATKSGEPGKPIVWRGAGDGEAVLGGANAQAPAARAIAAAGAHDVWFEKLTLRHAKWGIVANDGVRIVVRRCHISGIHVRGITFCGNSADATSGFFISDNVLEGLSAWPRTQGIEDMNAIHGTGFGHVVCYNRIRGFADAADTFASRSCYAIDFHNNDVSELTDDGFEMDYSQRNTRCFHNRLTNVFQGISVQPVFGGPVYVFRNAMYNVEVEPFKMHNSPSGALMFHNTVVKKGPPLLLATPEKVRNCVYRNNLFIGTEGRAYHCDPPMADCDFDCDGFGGWSGDVFMKWNNVRYATLDEVRAKCPVYKHAVLVDPATAFANGAKAPEDVKKQCDLSANDLRLKEGSAAIDAGQVLPNFNDGFAGKAPDLGAYELGGERPHYGPRPEK